MSDYIQVTFELENSLLTKTEILIAELSEIGYESFWEEENKLSAYISKAHFSKETLMKTAFFKAHAKKIVLKHEVLADKNWNDVWESNFKPVIIQNCIIRAPFHNTDKAYDFEIIIEPKMSFGTGHHETTSMIVELMLSMDFKKKRILDMGCGSGILAILAHKTGAASIDAVDNDAWAFENTKENFIRNNVEFDNIFLGGIEQVQGKEYDIILANITRNILFEMLPHFAKMQNKGGVLLLSGFLINDFQDMQEKAKENKYKLILQKVKNNWGAFKLSKIE
ncbi:MAG: 50S ribosomal protein L11 methyltransferase [Bacteroidales bacterium]|nr:50S ribosomal protein L11 methyltransferase [Bacteroidales bacterium]